MKRKVFVLLLAVGLLAVFVAPGIGKTQKLLLYFSGPQKMIEQIETASEQKHGNVLRVYGFKRILAEMAADKIPYHYSIDKLKVWEYATRFYRHAKY